LLLGLTQASMLTLAIVVGWLLVLGLREKRSWQESRIGFNFVQIGLGILTIIALSSLFFAIEQGLLGQPDM
jgi:heme A synthase